MWFWWNIHTQIIAETTYCDHRTMAHLAVMPLLQIKHSLYCVLILCMWVRPVTARWQRIWFQMIREKVCKSLTFSLSFSLMKTRFFVIVNSTSQFKLSLQSIFFYVAFILDTIRNVTFMRLHLILCISKVGIGIQMHQVSIDEVCTKQMDLIKKF